MTYRLGRVSRHIRRLPDIANKSHWMLAPSPTNANLKGPTWLSGFSTGTLDQFPVVGERWYWSHVEGAGSGTTSGTFDIDELTAMLSACAAEGKYFAPMLMWRKFETNTHTTPFGDTDAILPSDLVDDYQFSASGGFAGAIYTETVRTRYENVCKHTYDVLSSHADGAFFVGIQTQETAGMASCAAETYALAKLTTQLGTLNGNMSEYAWVLRKWWISYWNFLAGIGGSGANHQLRIDSLNLVYENARRDNTIVGTPDILGVGAPNYDGLSVQVYPYFTEETCVIREFPRFSSIQNDSYKLAQNGNFDVDQLVTTYAPLLDLSVIIWTAQNFGGAWDFSFSEPRSGYTYGDAEGVARLAWPADRAYNSDYAVAV